MKFKTIESEQYSTCIFVVLLLLIITIALSYRWNEALNIHDYVSRITASHSPFTNQSISTDSIPIESIARKLRIFVPASLVIGLLTYSFIQVTIACFITSFACETMIPIKEFITAVSISKSAIILKFLLSFILLCIVDDVSIPINSVSRSSIGDLFSLSDPHGIMYSFDLFWILDGVYYSYLLRRGLNIPVILAGFAGMSGFLFSIGLQHLL